MLGGFQRVQIGANKDLSKCRSRVRQTRKHELLPLNILAEGTKAEGGIKDDNNVLSPVTGRRIVLLIEIEDA